MPMLTNFVGRTSFLGMAALGALGMLNQRAYSAPKGDALNTGEILNTGDNIVSIDGKYIAVMQGDGNLCVYRVLSPGNSQFVWGTVQVGRYNPSPGNYIA